MDEKYFLTIVVRKEVASESEGMAKYQQIKTRLETHPDVKVSGNVSVQFIEEPEVTG